MRHYVDAVIGTNGTAISGASVTVRVANATPGTGALATIYSDDGITTTANPVITDATGSFGFYVADGRYDLTVSIAGFTKIVADIEIADITQQSSGDSTANFNNVLIAGTLGVSGAFTAQSTIDKLCVGPSPCFATVAAAQTAAGLTNKTIIEIRSSYAGTDCGTPQTNISYIDYRGMNPPCNTNNSILFSPSTSMVTQMLFEVIMNSVSPASGTAVTATQFNTLVTGTLPGASGIVDGHSATAFTTGAMSGTLGTLRGAEIAAAVNGAGGAVTIAEGAAFYVAGLGGTTTTIGTARGVTGIGCNGQTYGSAPTNCYGGYFLKQQGKAATRNYALAWEGPGLMVFDTINSSSAELQAEDNTNTARTLLKVDSGNNTILQAVAGAGLLLRDNGSTARISISGSDVRLPTQTTIANINAAGSPIALGAVTSQKTETQAADANVLTFTPPAVAGTWRVSVAISVSSATNGVISYTVSWTDSNGNGQSNIAGPLFQYGTAAPNTTFTTSAAGNYKGEMLVDVNAGANNIVVKWVGGGTTAAKMSAAIERVI